MDTCPHTAGLGRRIGAHGIKESGQANSLGREKPDLAVSAGVKPAQSLGEIMEQPLSTRGFKPGSCKPKTVHFPTPLCTPHPTFGLENTDRGFPWIQGKTARSVSEDKKRL